MASFSWPPSSGGGGVPIYSTFSAFPPGSEAGDLAVAADTGTLYEWNGSSWQVIAGPGLPLSLGAFGSSPNADGLALAGNVLSMEPADGTNPGGVSTTTQTFAGNKTFSGTIGASNLSGTNSGDVTLGTANGLSITGQALSLGTSSTSTTGALTSTDWNTFNGKQASGSYITALTGDVTASGPGSAAATVAKIQGTAVGGTTGTGNVVFSDSPTLSGTVAGALTFSGDTTFSGSGTGITVSNNALFSGQISATNINNNGGTGNASNGAVASGSYTPAQVSTNTNVASVTFNSLGWQWIRVGNVVTVSGILPVTPTAGSSATTIVKFSLPVASTIASGFYLAGTGAEMSTGTNGAVAAVSGDTSNNCVVVTFPAQSTSAHNISCTFTYRVN